MDDRPGNAPEPGAVLAIMLGFLFGNYRNVYVQPAPAAPGVGHGQFAMLEQRVDSLELACAALWRILKEHNGFTDEQLQALIHQIDAEDGAVDGKIRAATGACPNCGQKLLSKTAGKCLWCGAPLTAAPFAGTS